MILLNPRVPEIKDQEVQTWRLRQIQRCIKAEDKLDSSTKVIDTNSLNMNEITKVLLEDLS